MLQHERRLRDDLDRVDTMTRTIPAMSSRDINHSQAGAWRCHQLSDYVYFSVQIETFFVVKVNSLIINKRILISWLLWISFHSFYSMAFIIMVFTLLITFCTTI